MSVVKVLTVLLLFVLEYSVSQVVYKNGDIKIGSRIWSDTGGSNIKRDLHYDVHKQVLKYDGVQALCVKNVNSPTLSIPFNTDRRATPELTMIVWLYRNHGRVQNKEWLLGHDDGGYDRALLVYDHRFSGMAMGVGYTYKSIIPTAGRNKWTFVAATFSNSKSESQLYKGLNDYDKLFTQKVKEHKTISHRNYVTIWGLPQYGNTHTYSGCIGQIELIPRVLTRKEINDKFIDFRNKFPNLNGNQIIYNNDDLKDNIRKWEDSGNSGRKRDLIYGPKNVVRKFNNVNALCLQDINSPLLNIDFNTDRRNTPELTMLLWLYRDRARQRNNEWVLGNDDGGYDRALLVYDNRFGGMAMGVGRTYKSNIPTAIDNKWTFVVATFSDLNSKATLYYGVDGNPLLKQIVSEGKTYSNRKTTLFGLPQYGNTHTYAGCIGQIMLYNRILTNKEIKLEYNYFKNKFPDAHINNIIYSNNDLGKTSNYWKDSGESFKKRNLGYSTNDKTIKSFNGVKGLCMNNINSNTLRIEYDTDRRVTPELTMIVWVYREHGRTRNTEWLLGHDDGGYDRAILLYDGRFGGLAMGVGGTYKSTIAGVGDNEWTFIAATFSDITGKATIYKGFNNYPNLLSQTVQEGKTISNRNDVTVFGLPQYGNTHTFYGCIGEIQILNRVLKPIEIKGKYNDFRNKFPNININELILKNNNLKNNLNKWKDTGSNNKDLSWSNQHHIQKYNNINALCMNNINSNPLTIHYNTNRRNSPELTMIVWVFRDRPRIRNTEWVLGHDDGGFDKALLIYDGRFGGMAMGVGYPYKSQISTAPDNRWTFIAATFNDITGKATLYRGLGRKRLSIQEVTEHKTSSVRKYITLFGLPQYGNTHTFLGCIGQIEIINRVLTKNEINKRYDEFKEVLPKSHIDNIIYSNIDLNPSKTVWSDSGESFKQRDLIFTNDKTKSIELLSGVNALCIKNKNDATLRIKYNTDRRATPELTMIVWLFREKRRQNNNEWLLGHDDGGYDRALLVYDNRFNGMAMGVGYQYKSIISTADYYKWTFIAATFSDKTGKAKLYKGYSNTNLIIQEVNEHKTLSNRKDITLFGLPQYKGSHTFVGCIGEIQILNRVLTPKEIRDKFNAFKDIVPLPLVNRIIYSNYDLRKGYNVWEDTGDSWKSRNLIFGNDKEIKVYNGIKGLCGKDINTKTLTINFNTNRDLSPELTMIVWVYRNQNRARNTEWLLGHDDGGYDRALLIYDIRFNGMAMGVGYVYRSNLITPPNNEWTFIAGTFSDLNNIATLYRGNAKDTQLSSQTVKEHKTLSSREVITLFGLPQYGNTHSFLGCIGEIQLIGRVLTSNQVNEKFNAFKTLLS